MKITMPLPQNLHAIIGASVLGVFCAATLYFIEHYRQERRRHGMAKQIQRLDTEVSVLRRELNQFLSRQNERLKLRKRCNLSESAIDDYASALDSSDLEFYDVSTDEETQTPRQRRQLDNVLLEIDEKIEIDSNLTRLLSNLYDLYEEYPENPEILWRIGKVHYKIIQLIEDKNEILKNIENGIKMCEKGTNLQPELYECHKWLAILIGARCDYQPIKEKIQDGQLFKKHVERAIELNNKTDKKDSSLNYMLGRFIYEYANLKWYEKKAANLICSANGIGMPDANYNIALDLFEKAAHLNTQPWKENYLMIAKCKIGLNDINGALEQLNLANSIENDNGTDDKVDVEVKQLLQKYS